MDLLICGRLEFPLIELSMAQSIDRVIFHSIREYTYVYIWMGRLRAAVVVGHVLHVVHLIGPYILIMANILLPFCILSVPPSFLVSPGPRNSCILYLFVVIFLFFRLVNVWFLGPFFAKFRFFAGSCHWFELPTCVGPNGQMDGRITRYSNGSVFGIFPWYEES